ncbi:hypothetical protein RchiOBHm_Chr5g0007691 [Rosa chinensis]|uniref:Uncharacterized protein n=1 Tax=Rosa chinensis TaxID=74649 RepID=A0A2P6Q3V7_ROSCH|nr:hypothetical protein RchiOBHm_Chr5g0007691 [Rosa chinensis]
MVKYSVSIDFCACSSARMSSTVSFASNLICCMFGRCICNLSTVGYILFITNLNILHKASGAQTHLASTNCLISSNSGSDCT